MKVVNIGTVPNDGTGDAIRDAFAKVNENFAEIEGGLLSLPLGGAEGQVLAKLSDEDREVGWVNPEDGAQGLSAYEVAVADGFNGSETDWLATLVGPPGATGAPGPGVAPGGNPGQVLAKSTAADFDTVWVTPTGGGGGGVSMVSPGDGISVTGTSEVPVINVASTVVRTAGPQTIGGTKTFTSFPMVPAINPVQDTQVAHKRYVDEQIEGVNAGALSILGGDGIDVTGTATRTIEVDNTVVRTGAVQTISGIKTFSSTVLLSGSNSHILSATSSENIVLSGGASPVSGGNIVLWGGTAPGNSSAGWLRSDGIAQARWSSTGFHVSNSSNVVLTADPQTIGGTKTFTSSPILPSPSNDNHAATKKYVDDAVGDIPVTPDGVLSLTAGTGVAITGTPEEPIISVDGTIATTSYVDDEISFIDTGVMSLSAGGGVSISGTTSPTVSVDATVVRTAGDQTLGGIKTFSSIPILPSTAPTLDNQAASKAYVDANAGESYSAGTGISLSDFEFSVDSSVVVTSGAQTIGGTKTFSSIPVVPASNPTTVNQVTRKGYVDDLDAGNVKLTGTQLVAGVKTFSDTIVADEIHGLGGAVSLRAEGGGSTLYLDDIGGGLTGPGFSIAAQWSDELFEILKPVRIGKGVYEELITSTGTGVHTIDCTVATTFVHNMTGNTTYEFTSPGDTVTSFTLIMVHAGAGRQVTWPDSVLWAGGTPPTLSTTSGSIDVVTFVTYSGGISWLGFPSGIGFS